MRVSVLLFTLAVAAFAGSPAKATSLTIDFPTNGDSWADIASGNHGTLTGGGYTGELTSAGSYVTSSGNSYASLNNFVATAFSATFDINNTQYDTINYSIGGSGVDIFLDVAGGPEQYTTGTQSLPSPTLLSSTSPITFTLDYDVGQTNGSNYIEFGPGTVTLTGYYATPEPSTWAMLLLGFGGLGVASYRTARRKEKAASV